MEETVNQLTISELIRRGQPLTATATLNSSPSFPIPSSFSKSKTPPPPPDTTINSNPRLSKILSPLTHPAVLVGSLTLPTETLKCTNKNCFQFSDGSSTICCDILDFSVPVIGKRIHVLSWNFIPLKHSPGGFLEIIKCSFPDSTNNIALSRCSSVDSIPIISVPSPSSKEDRLKARYRLHGPIESISPVSIVPCSVGANKSKNLRGFIAQIRVCECKLCISKEPIKPEQQTHVFTKPSFVYFFGSSMSWHPVITKLVRKVVTLSGLKKKLVFIGKEESQLMFVITENSVIHLPRVAKNWSPFLRNVVLGKGECGDYKGAVSVVYMQGMVVELDKEVWLLLTDQLLAVPHSLRVGAIVTLRNVHFVNPKFSWTKMLILGACLKTSITVDSFSPLETGCHMISHSQSQLGKFLESLNFSARMWTLLVIYSFRKKFGSILSERDILGSKHKEGLAHMFASSHVPPAMIRVRHGILTESCQHDAFGCGREQYCANLKLVPPISTFLHHCESMWMKVLVQLERNCRIWPGNSSSSLLSCKGRSHGRTLRRIFQSEDIGVSLLGSLKISPSSGRLQLVDAMGSIDVIVPDLPSGWKSNGIYEVGNYSLIMEGTPDLVDYLGLPRNESFSCRHIFHCTSWTRKINLTLYIYFRLSNAIWKKHPSNPFLGWNYDHKELQGRRFHLIWVTHKYPVLQKFQGELLISDNSTMFAEAIILPWDLFLPGKDGTRLPVKVSGDRPDEPLVNCSIENYQEHPPNKKCKIDQASSETLASDMMNDCNNGCCELRTCSSLSKGSTDGKCGNLNSLLEIPCSITVRHGNIYSSFGSGKLCCTKCKTDTGACFKPSTEKVLLEFNTENFIKYQSLQIGSYYIINHHPEESLCSIRNHNYISGVKIFISSKIHLWSLFFSSDEVIRNNRSSSDASQGDSSSSSRESLRRFQVEPLLRVTDKSPESCSDVFLYLAANAMWFFDIKLNARKGADTDPPTAPEETSNYSISSSSLSYGSLDYTVFPEGNLTSVHGDVVAIHGFDDNSADISLSCNRLGDVLDMRFSQGKTSGSCIHVLVDNQVVTIFGSLSKYALPVGFGPDVNATFHRILKFRGTNKLMLTPVSFIVLNSIRVTNELFTEKCSDIQSSNISSASSLDNVSSGIISELIQHADGKPLQFNCRVAAVHVVVLEKNRKYYDLPSEVEYRPDFVDIPLVGLVLDDGSSTCCCWANAERAATLLRLHEELPERAFESSGCTFKWVGIEKSCWKNTVYHLERILSKHDSITVRNYGSVVESSHQDLRVSVHSDNALSSSDENLLKFILFNACFGTLWTVVANVMDPNAVKQLEKEHLMQMEMTVLPIQNIWAKEVRYVNNLTEARNIMRELLDR
ncbi:CST complex subunit CTC1 isoform X1 [Ricinus communis]|uniref:CST complex subunit CTC1 isoform X1 n=1 Tax=Ricinus communis TaxID=3988 RepID=UPI00201AF2FB|nr:CST complex subunit CTC1 isoform X1 [Ricinus communis]